MLLDMLNESLQKIISLKTNHYLISAGCTHDSCGLFCGYVITYYHVSPSMQRACVLYRKSKDFIWVLRGCCFYYQGNTRAAAGYPSQGMQSIATPAVFFFFFFWFVSHSHHNAGRATKRGKGVGALEEA